jgi:hypothetical protein
MTPDAMLSSFEAGKEVTESIFVDLKRSLSSASYLEIVVVWDFNRRSQQQSFSLSLVSAQSSSSLSNMPNAYARPDLTSPHLSSYPEK